MTASHNSIQFLFREILKNRAPRVSPKRYPGFLVLAAYAAPPVKTEIFAAICIRANQKARDLVANLGVATGYETPVVPPIVPNCPCLYTPLATTSFLLALLRPGQEPHSIPPAASSNLLDPEMRAPVVAGLRNQ